jgi:hypothetical protein
MIDITNYSDNELSLQVHNDLYFYSERHHLDFLCALVKEEFYFTPKQLEVMIEDITETVKEEAEGAQC